MKKTSKVILAAVVVVVILSVLAYTINVYISASGPRMPLNSITIPPGGILCNESGIYVVIVNTGFEVITDEDIVTHTVNGNNFPLPDFSIDTNKHHIIATGCGGPCQSGQNNITIGLVGDTKYVGVFC